MIKEYWSTFLKRNSLQGDIQPAATLCFGMDAKTADAAAEDIIGGKRRGCIQPAHGYRQAMNGGIQPGQKSIVVGWDGTPQAVIQTETVQNIRFAELDDALCSLEGAGMTRERWLEERMPVLKMELEEIGEMLSDDTELIVETFCVLYH